MDNNKITFKVTIALDEEWSSNLTMDEMIGYIRDKLDTTLGFRGEIKKFRVVNK